MRVIDVHYKFKGELKYVLPQPRYATPDSAGMDLRAHVLAEPLVIHPGERRLVKTGLRLAIPRGYEGQIRPRSGMALKHGVTVLNSPGTIDADYRGEIGVILVNHGDVPYSINQGERIAQIVFCEVARAHLMEVDDHEELPSTARGEGGFGSTGV